MAFFLASLGQLLPAASRLVGRRGRGHVGRDAHDGPVGLGEAGALERDLELRPDGRHHGSGAGRRRRGPHDPRRQLDWPVIKDMLFMPFFCVLFLGPNILFFRARVLCQNNLFFGSVFLPKILGREGGLDVWTIRWLRELFLLCQLVVKLGARAAMGIYGGDADELAHCVALHVIEMKIDDKIIVRKCSRVLRLIMERTGRRAAMFPFAVVLAGMERALISPLPSDDMAREPLVRDLCSPGSPGPTQLPRVTAEERAFVEESTQVLHFLNELADIDGPLTPLRMLLDDACLTLRELVYP